jgi:dihydroflavonol-4-reductase
MKILVTGASGFIGNALAHRLLADKYEVRLLARNPESVSGLVGAGAVAVRGDVTVPESCALAAEGADAIFHCAGALGGWRRPEALLWDVNLKGTHNMLEAARRADAGCFIHASSCGIFGPLKKGEIAGDARPINPTNAYEKSKAAAEGLAMEYSARGLPVTVLRPEFVYGPGDLHLLPLFRAVAGGRFVYFGDGSSTLHPTYIDDVVEAMVAALRNKRARGLAMNIAGERPLSVREFIETMCRGMGLRPPSIHIPLVLARAAGLLLDSTMGLVAKPPLTYAQVRYLSENRAFSTHLAAEVIGYKPSVGLPEGMRRAVSWYRGRGLL